MKGYKLNIFQFEVLNNGCFGSSVHNLPACGWLAPLRYGLFQPDRPATISSQNGDGTLKKGMSGFLKEVLGCKKRNNRLFIRKAWLVTWKGWSSIHRISKRTKILNPARLPSYPSKLRRLVKFAEKSLQSILISWNFFSFNVEFLNGIAFVSGNPDPVMHNYV